MFSKLKFVAIFVVFKQHFGYKNKNINVALNYCKTPKLSVRDFAAEGYHQERITRKQIFHDGRIKGEEGEDNQIFIILKFVVLLSFVSIIVNLVLTCSGPSGLILEGINFDYSRHLHFYAELDREKHEAILVMVFANRHVICVICRDLSFFSFSEFQIVVFKIKTTN